MSAAGAVSEKRSHRSRSGRGPEDLRRRVDGCNMEVDSPSLSRLSMYTRMLSARSTLISTRPILFPRTQPRFPLHRSTHVLSREIRVDARELVKDAKERERRGARVCFVVAAPRCVWRRHYPNAALQGPNDVTQWYVGVLGAKIGDPAFGGDSGFELSCAFSAIVYPIAHYIERRFASPARMRTAVEGAAEYAAAEKR
ncbi:hypothetical protein DFH11DRAFT_1730281 [Phellopilus nigrolimitatus]|nr:hypothetical protein DFH11DRAFT_1730281 [Phellopilus nigrolimitatus]